MSIQYTGEEQLTGTYGVADSFPKDFEYGVDEADREKSLTSSNSKHSILLLGMRHSGTISIQKVAFHKMSPNETLFLESTNKIYKDDISNNSFVNFQIWDFPVQVVFFDPTFDYEMIFRGTGALIYVIASQGDYIEALARLHVTVSKAYKVYPDMNIKWTVYLMTKKCKPRGTFIKGPMMT